MVNAIDNRSHYILVFFTIRDVWRGRGSDVVFGGRRGRRENRARRRVDGRGDAVLGRFVGRVPGRKAQRLRPQCKASAHVGKLVDNIGVRCNTRRTAATAIDVAGRRAAILGSVTAIRGV